jgi:hypothetical protein
VPKPTQKPERWQTGHPSFGKYDLRRKYRETKRNALTRRLDFRLSFIEFLAIVSKPCAYAIVCDQPTIGYQSRDRPQEQRTVLRRFQQPALLPVPQRIQEQGAVARPDVNRGSPLPDTLRRHVSRAQSRKPPTCSCGADEPRGHRRCTESAGGRHRTPASPPKVESRGSRSSQRVVLVPLRRGVLSRLSMSEVSAILQRRQSTSRGCEDTGVEYCGTKSRRTPSR